MKRLVLLFFILSPLVGVRADGMVEAKTMMGMKIKTWTAGLKQRNEIPNPMTGGTIVTITRVDKGVQWTIDLQLKVYDEKPIALPYQKNSTEAEMINSAKQGNAEKAPKLEIRKTDRTRMIAGFSATSYEVKADGKHSAELWLTPYTPMLEQMDKETREFGEAHTRELYKNYPAAERKEMEVGMSMMAGMVKGQLPAQASSDLSKGYTLAMEGESSMETAVMDTMADRAPTAPKGETSKKSTLYEVLSLTADKINANQFEIPPSFKKVDDVAALQAQELMKAMMNGKGDGVNMEEMMKNLPKGATSGASQPDE